MGGSLALVLDAEEHDGFGVGERGFEIVGDFGAEGGEIFGDERGRADEGDFRAEFPKCPDIGAGDAAEKDIAEDGDLASGEIAEVLAHGEAIEQGLGRVFVRAVAGVYDGDAEEIAEVLRRSGGAVAEDDKVGVEGLDILGGVAEGFSFNDAAGGGVDGDDVGAEPFRGHFEGDAGAGARFEEEIDDGFAFQRGRFSSAAQEFFERGGDAENRFQFVARQFLDGYQIFFVPAHPVAFVRLSFCHRGGRACQSSRLKKRSFGEAEFGIWELERKAGGVMLGGRAGEGFLFPLETMSMETSIFAALPGIETPVGKISQTLSRIWDSPSGPSEFRASQMNLILHFGRGTVPDEAREIFDISLRFSQRYPSRIIVLCPDDHPKEGVLLKSKIFSECYIGKSGRERTCVEAIVLAYPWEGKDFVENQVSILLETELPTYYWQHHFKAAKRVTDYAYFLKIARRVVFDSRREKPEVRQVEWPRPEIIRDLAYTSLLPVRQSIGQFLSGFEPEELVRGLTKVEVSHSGQAQAEALAMLRWLEEALNSCADRAKISRLGKEAFGCSEMADGEKGMEIRFRFEDERYFHWCAHRELKIAEIEANFGRGEIQMPTTLKLLKPEAALAEAFFF